MKKIILSAFFLNLFFLGYSQYVNNTGELIREEQRNTQKEINLFLEKNPNYLKDNNIDKGDIVRIVNNTPFINKNYNDGSAGLIRADQLYTDLSIHGEGMYAGVWDGGQPLSTHQSLVGRVNNWDGSAFLSSTTSQNRDRSSHATHVSGTIIGTGQGGANSSLYAGVKKGRGIAFAASGVYNSNWTNDINEMQDFAADKYTMGKNFVVSNHSYGYDYSALGTDKIVYGFYNDDSRNIDLLMSGNEDERQNPYYIPVFAAGNDRTAAYNPDKGGYDLITGKAVAKNCITVAAVQLDNIYNPSLGGTISNFSNFGPTDDGRIKPDIAAKGVSVYSSVAYTGTTLDDSAYESYNGTSMAAPAITGGVLLLQQYYEQLNNVYMRAATAKGLLLHTATEAGTDNGPDYEYGWGIANLKNAAQAITDNGSNSIISELNLSNGATYTKTVKASGLSDIRVSISWIDPAHTVVDYILDNPIKMLVNDLDVEVTKGSSQYFPWKLGGMSDFYLPATNDSTNDVDNFERVDIYSPVADDEYTITVSHKGILSGGTQKYTLIVTGIKGVNLGVDDIAKSTFKAQLYPNPAQTSMNVSIQKAAKYTVFDTTGKLITNGDFSEGVNTLNVSSFAKGIYLIKLENGSNVETSKFMVK